MIEKVTFILTKSPNTIFSSSQHVLRIDSSTSARNEDFRNYLLSKIPPEEIAKAEKIATEQNTTIDEILKKKFAEIIEKLRAE